MINAVTSRLNAAIMHDLKTENQADTETNSLSEMKTLLESEMITTLMLMQKTILS